MQLPEIVSHDRDYRMLEARKNGANFREIGKVFNVSPSTAHAGVSRALRAEGTRYMKEMDGIGWLFAERYDTLLRDLMPFTKAQKIMDHDTGKEVRVPPSYEAVDRVLKVMGEMKKMYGMDKDGMSFESNTAGAALDSAEGKGEVSPSEYATKVLAELIKVGAIEGANADRLTTLLGEAEEAEIVESDDEQLAIEAVRGVPSLMEPREQVSAPEWVDDDEEDYEPGEWIPTKMGEAAEYGGG